MSKGMLNCSNFLLFPNIGLVARNNKKALLINRCLLLFHPAVCDKILKLSIQHPRT